MSRIKYSMLGILCIASQSNPLCWDAFDVQAQVGFEPIVWAHRAPVITGSPFPSSQSPVLQIFSNPRFSKFFHIPWTVGGQVGYAVCDSIRIYGECNYTQARHKPEILTITPTTPALFAEFIPTAFKLVDAYIGGQYYWDGWHDRVDFFCGAKLGLAHHFEITTTLNLIEPSVETLSLTNVLLSNHNTSISGGINAGCTICFCGNWLFLITGEIVANTGPNINQDITLSPTISHFTTAAIGSIGAEVRFPITAAIRYLF
jgi:hypothetical protein